MNKSNINLISPLMSFAFLPALRNLPCPAHPEEKCSIVCFGEECAATRLICPECQFFDHKDHETMPLGLILFEVQSDLQHQNGVIAAMAKMDIENEKIQKACMKIGNEKEKDLIEHSIEHFKKDISYRISEYIDSERKLMENGKQFYEINAFLQKYKSFPKETQEEKKLSNYELFLKEILHYVRDIAAEFQELVKKRSEVTDILTIFSPFESQSRVRYIFSDVLKHTSITLSEDKLTATQKNNYSTNFVFIQPALQGKRTLRSKRSVKFQIGKLMSWLSIGVAYKQLATKAAFYFNTGAVGHGGYLISNNGYSWHHSDSALNSFYMQWSYVQDDILVVTIDPKQKKIIFQKENSTGEPYELPYEVVPGDELYFCVSLSSHDESVSIVQ